MGVGSLLEGGHLLEGGRLLEEIRYIEKNPPNRINRISCLLYTKRILKHHT